MTRSAEQSPVASRTPPRERRLEADVLRPPERLRPSEWAERYRVLPQGQTDLPGPWLNENAPYLRGIMDLIVAPGVSEVAILKFAQGGISEACRNVTGYLAHTDPDPVGWALPDRPKGRKIMQNRLIPLFEDTPALAELLSEHSRDLQSEEVRLRNNFHLQMMWSGSSSSLSSDPLRLVVADEIDKFSPWTGRDASPVANLRARLRSFGERGRAVWISTPTTRLRIDGIAQMFFESDVLLYYFVPCPLCGHWQRLLWPQLRWTHYDDPDPVERSKRVRHGRVWYECAHCRAEITEDRKHEMVRRGHWADEEGQYPDAEAEKEWPAGTRLGLQISALYCLWDSWARLAATFTRALGNLAKMYDFTTQEMGMPFEHRVLSSRPDLYSKRAATAALAEGIVPAWCVKLLCTIDTQQDHFYAVLRAWGRGLRSARVWHGKPLSFQELDDLCFGPGFQVEGKPHLMVQPGLVLIDSGGTRAKGDMASRTMAVYQWALGRRSRVRAIKGASQITAANEMRPFWLGKGLLSLERRPTGSRRSAAAAPNTREVPLVMINTQFCNDLLADLVARGHGPAAEGEPAGEEVWHLNRRDDAEYNFHLANMHKVERQTARGRVEEWVPQSDGVRVDYRDCEVYQVAGAYMARVHLLPVLPGGREDEEGGVGRDAAKGKSKERRDRAARRDPWSTEL